MSDYIIHKKTPCGECALHWAPCPVCKGTGHTLTEVDLIDVLRELGVFFRLGEYVNVPPVVDIEP